jgi:hypothetical protein
VRRRTSWNSAQAEDAALPDGLERAPRTTCSSRIALRVRGVQHDRRPRAQQADRDALAAVALPRTRGSSPLRRPSGAPSSPSPSRRASGSESAVYARDPETFVERVERVIRISMQFWERPTSVLYDWTIEYVPWDESTLSGYPSGDTNKPLTQASGVCYLAAQTIRVRTRDPECVERAVVPHELGHVALWFTLDGQQTDADIRHEDPRWSQVEPVLWPRLKLLTRERGCDNFYSFAHIYRW